MKSGASETPISRRGFLRTSAAGGLMLAASEAVISRADAGESEQRAGPAYEPKRFGGLLGMDGFSDTLLKNHFKLYEGYVKNTNKALAMLKSMLEDDKAGYEYGEVRRRLGWEFNGMRLHELYFGNLGGKTPFDKAGKLAVKLAKDFGGRAAWEKEFRKIGGMRGIGWVALYQDNANGRLINFWINEHDAGHPAGCSPILILDVFEHAFMTDYGLKKADYIEAFFKNVDWAAAGRRLQ